MKAAGRNRSRLAARILAGALLAVTLPVGFRHFAAQSLESRILQHSRPSETVQRFLNRKDAHPARTDGTFPCVSESLGDPAPASPSGPQLSKCAMPLDHPGPAERFEADLRYGNFVLRQTDLSIHDVFDVPLTRTYTSRDLLGRNRLHAFGKNASHGYDWTLAKSAGGYTQMMAVLEDGDFLYFYRVSQGNGYPDAIFQHTETSTPFYKSVISWNGDSCTLSRQDGSSILFPSSRKTRNSAGDAPYGLRDAQGNVLRLIRDSEGHLTEIRTPHDHWIRLQYDELFEVTLATDDQGNSVRYFYNQDGMLSDVRWSGGRSRHYAYEADRLVAVTDEQYHVLVQNNYLNGWLVSQSFPNEKQYAYYYGFAETNSNHAYADSVTVLLPDGATTIVKTANSVPDHLRHPL